jgi:hypothetical protein
MAHRPSPVEESTMYRWNRFAWAIIVLAFACGTVLAQQGGNGGQGGTGGTGGQGGNGGQGGGLSGGGQGGGMGGVSGTPLIPLEQPPIITAPGATTGGGAGSGGVDASNIFAPYYGNPYYQGIPENARSGVGNGGFGSSLYNSTGGGAGGRGMGGTTGARTTTGARGGIGGVGGRGLGGVGGRGLGGSNQSGVIVPLPVSISYPAIATFPITPAPASQLQADISGMIGRTNAIASPAGVTATVENGIVTLRGTVRDPGEAKALANMIRLTPGVRGIRNDLTIAKQ